MSSETPRRMYLHPSVDEATFDALMRYATQQGMHTSELLEKWIIEKLMEQIDESDPELKFFKTTELSKQRDRMKNNMRNLIWKAIREDDENTLDSLRLLCEENKLSFDTMMESVDEKGDEPVIYENPLGINAATAFLQENTLAGQEYKVSILQELTTARGFSEGVVNAAKRNLKFRSIHRGGGWYWIR